MNAEPPERVGLGGLGERGLIRRIRRSAAATGAAPGVEVGIGDDTAVLAVPAGHKLLATTDLLIEDVHFRRISAAPSDIGWKALAVNLSDIAAMGGIPRWALVALAVPADTDVEAVDAFYAGMAEAAAAGLHALELGLDRAREAGVTGARLAEITRAHLRPRARVAEGRWLGQAPGVHAMMDCSDGLATDLAHVCRESGVGARVRLDQVPISAAARETAPAVGGDAREWAASGGEDYELLLTCDPAAADRLVAGLAEATGTALTVIGRIEGSAGEIVFVDADGASVPMRGGYEHFHG